MAPTDHNHTLDLGHLAHRPQVRINGKTYALKSPREFAFLAFVAHQRKFLELSTLLRKKRRSKSDAQAISRLLDEFVRTILVAPDALHASLDDGHRFEIVQFFSKLLPTTTPPSGRGTAASPRR